MNVHIAQFVGHFDLFQAAEGSPFALHAVAHHGDVVDAQHHVLRRADDGLAIGRLHEIVRCHHHTHGFGHGLVRQGHVDGHLVAVEVGVEGSADQWVQLDRLALDQFGHERLDAQAVQRRRAVEQDGPPLDDLFQHFPDLGRLALHEALGPLDVAGVAVLDELADDERPEQLQRHRLRQATFAHLQLRADDDYRTAGVVDALAQQVATEAPLLALQHVRQGLEFAPAAAAEGLAALAVVDKAIDRFLQHALLVADDDIRRAQFQQALEAVVAVDDAAIEIVQVGRGEAAAVQLHHRPQVGRDDRQHGQDHPLRPVAAGAQRLDHLQALGGPLGRLLAAAGAHFAPQVAAELLQIHALEDLVERLGAHAGAEDVAELALQLAVVVLIQERHLRQRFELVAVSLGLLAQTDHFLIHPIAQPFAGHTDLAAQLFDLATERFQVALLLFLSRALDRLQAFLGDLVDQNSVFAADGLALLNDEFTGQDDVLGGARTLQVRQPLFDVLGFLHQLVGAGAQAVVEAAMQLVANGLALGQARGGLTGRLLQLLAQLRVQLALRLLELLIQPLQRALARLFVDVGDDVLGEVENAVEVTARNVQQQAHVAGHAPGVPDVGHGRGQLNVAQALAANGRAGDLHATLVADDPLVADILILAAVALPVARRAKDGLAEQAVLLRTQPAVVNRLRLGHFTIGPRANLLRRRQTDA